MGNSCCGPAPSDDIQVPANLKISWSEIRIDEQIGQGGFGKVFKGMWQGNRVAVKLLAPERITRDSRRNLAQEAVLMSQLSHPCVARVFGLVDEPDHLALVMCYYRKGTLEEFMTRPSTKLQYQELDIIKRVSMALQVAKGMAFLHDRKILHGDLKASNLLMDEQMRVYITDFGLARDLNLSHKKQLKYGHSPETSMLSVQISPPEVLMDPIAPRGPPVDVYAFGIVLLEIMTGSPAFRMNPQMIQTVVQQGKRPVIPNEIPDDIKHVISMCWAQEAVDRPTFTVIVTMLDEILRKIMERYNIEPDTQYTKMI